MNTADLWIKRNTIDIEQSIKAYLFKSVRNAAIDYLKHKTVESISSLFDKALNQDLADSQNPYDIGQPVKETSAKREIATFIPGSSSDWNVAMILYQCEEKKTD